jgi:hypothetical protein
LKDGKTVETNMMSYVLKDGLLYAKNQTGSLWGVNPAIYDTERPYVEEPKQLKLEVGKFYKTRDGRKAWLMECTDMKGAFPFRVATQRECSTYVITKDGRRYFEDTDGTDLVAPWED